MFGWAIFFLIVAIVAGVLGFAWRLRRPHEAEIRVGEQRFVVVLLWLGAFVCLAAQIPTVLGLFGARAFGVFFASLFFLVAYGSYLFARMLFLWRG